MSGDRRTAKSLACGILLAVLTIGYAYMAKNQPEEAAREFNIAIDMGLKDPGPHIPLGDLSAAKAYYQEALKLSSPPQP